MSGSQRLRGINKSFGVDPLSLGSIVSNRHVSLVLPLSKVFCVRMLQIRPDSEGNVTKPRKTPNKDPETNCKEVLPNTEERGS